MTDYRTKLLALADKLIAEETVDTEEFEKLFSDLPPKENLHGISLLPTAGTSTFSNPAVPPAAAPNPSPSAS